MNAYILNSYSSLGTKKSFNQSLKHLISVTNILELVSQGANLADIINDLLQQGVLDKTQILPIVSVILNEKLKATYVCKNLNENSKADIDFKDLADIFQSWNAIEFVCIYHHPHIGIAILNPAKVEQWEDIQGYKKNELMILYARCKKPGEEKNEKLAMLAITKFFSILEGKNEEADPNFKMPVSAKVAPPPKATPVSAIPKTTEAQVPKKKIQVTPKYSVQVSNELFHNGNVEAWKNIIESYHQKHSDCKVIVFHEGELIQDLNSLFKWGKVKHGGVILFQVIGPQIKNVSRLQKYLFEAASQRYETFMKHDINKSLQLF